MADAAGAGCVLGGHAVEVAAAKQPAAVPEAPPGEGG